MPLAFCVLNAHTPAVGSKPLAKIIPVPLISKKLLFCNVTVDVCRSKVKPPTLHRAGVLVDGLKMYGEAMTTEVPTAMLLKSPVFPPPAVTSVNAVTVVALPNDFLSKVAVPLMFSRPLIWLACALPNPTRQAAVAAKSVL